MNLTAVSSAARGLCSNFSDAASSWQLTLHWDDDTHLKPHHRDEWVSGSGIAPSIADLALESISGSADVLGFLNPKKLGKSYGYATMPVVRARKHYERPIKGGWLAYGHDPLADGQLAPVTYKPDEARVSVEGKAIKYERPLGSSPKPYFPPLDAGSYERIAARAGLTAEPYVSSWQAWQWLLAQSAVELSLDEGEKKAAAACSHGWLTIGLAGIWNGCPRPKGENGEAFGSHALIAELQWLRSIRPEAAPLTIAFDASGKARGRVAIRTARRILGRLLAEAGHAVRVREIPFRDDAEFIKGTDDLLVAGGSEALAGLQVQALSDWLAETSKKSVTDYLLTPFKTGIRRHGLITRHFRTSDIPRAGMVALIGGMGTNKTGAVAGLAATRKLVSVTHRRSLADNLGHRFKLPVKREGQVLGAFNQSSNDLKPAAELLIQADGFISVADSSHIGGTGEVTPETCSGAVLFIDEADAFLRHCLTAETAIKDKRCEVLANLANCVKAAEQVVLAGAHIDELTLSAFEAMRNSYKTHIVESTLQPSSGRHLTMHRKPEGLLQKLRNLAAHKEPFLFHTGSKEASSKFSPANLSRFTRKWWADARILELTAETIRDPKHPASRAIKDPQLLLRYDVVLASPVLETGFSIEDPDGHFTAVLGHTSGHTLPQAFVQSLGRLRSSVTRHVWCNHSGTRIGNGAPIASELQRTKLEHANRLALLHLFDAGDQAGDASRYVQWWSELGAAQNWFGSQYRHTVATLLEREGYAVKRLDLLSDDSGTVLSDELTAAREETIAEDTAAVAATPAPDDCQLELLEQRQRLTQEQRRMIERGRIRKHLGIKDPTAKQVELSRNGAHKKLMQHLLVIDAGARQRWKKQTLKSLSDSQRSYAPDTTKAMTPVARAEVMTQLPWVQELLALVGTGRTTTMQPFEAAQAEAQDDAYRWRELFGYDAGSGTTRTFVANLLSSMGLKLGRTTRRSRDGRRTLWHYEVLDELKLLNRSHAQTALSKALQ